MLSSPPVVYHFKGLDKNQCLVLRKCEAGVETDVVRIVPLTRNIPQPWGAPIVGLVAELDGVHMTIKNISNNRRELGPVLRNTVGGGWLLHDVNHN